MTTVRQLLEEKGYGIWTTTPETSVFGALQEMADRNVGALIVMDGGRIAGMFSERDYARKVALAGRSSRDMKVAEIMSVDVVTVTPRHSIEECMALMTDRRIRHLPVLVDGQVTGLVSIGDIVKSIIAELGRRRTQLLQRLVAWNVQVPVPGHLNSARRPIPWSWKDAWAPRTQQKCPPLLWWPFERPI